MRYDYVITKPDIDDIFIAHYGVKGMKWRHKKGGGSFSKMADGKVYKGGGHRIGNSDSKFKKGMRKAEYAVVSTGVNALQKRMAKNAKTARAAGYKAEKYLAPGNFDPSGVKYVINNMQGGSHGFDDAPKKKKDKNKNKNH